MNIKEKLKDFPFGFYILRGIGIFLLLMIIKSLMQFFVLLIYSTRTGRFEIFPRWAVFIIITVGGLFIYNSLIHIFTLYDRRVMSDFIKKKKRIVRFRSEIPSIIRSAEFLTETTVILLLTLFVSLLGGFPEIYGIFSDTGAPEWLLTLIPPIIALPLFFILSLFARYEVRRRWHWLDHIDNIDSLYSIPRLILNAFLIFFSYILIYPYGPLLIMAYLSLFGIFGALVDAYTVLGVVVAIIMLAAIIIAFTALNAIRIRKKLIKKLTRVAAESDYILSEISRPYISLFKPAKECNFTLQHGNKTFSCRLIGSFWQRAPMYFTSDKHAHYMHRIGTKNHHFDILSQFEYDFEGEGEKILILNPVPRRAFATQSVYIDNQWYNDYKTTTETGGSGRLFPGSRGRRSTDRDARMLEPGDRIWGYGIYNTTSFISAIDRKCLGRYTGMFE